MTVFIYGDIFHQYLGINGKEIGYYSSYQFIDNSTNTLYYSIKASTDDFNSGAKSLMILLSLNPFYIIYLIFENSFFTINLSSDIIFTYQGITLTEIPKTHLQLFPIFYSNFSNFSYDSWMIIMWLPYIYTFLFLLLIFLNKKNYKIRNN